MKNAVIFINSARPERWHITVKQTERAEVCCFYNQNSQCWAGLLSAPSMDALQESFARARNAMKTAREQNTRVEVTL